MASKLRTNYLPEIAALTLGRSKPSMVTVNLTDRCNQNCIYCEIGKKHTPTGSDPLERTDLIWIIDQMAIHKIHKISLCGGEPFLFEGIFDIVAYAKRKNVKCTITSNGMTIHQMEEKELKVLKESKTLINISVDSFDQKIQSLTRGADSALSNALKSIETLTKYGIPLTLLTVISKYNYQHLFEFTSTAYHKGIRQVLFQPVIYASNYPELQALDDKSHLNVPSEKLDVLMDELKKIHHFEHRHKINTNVYRILPWISSYLISAASNNGKWFFEDVLKKFTCREVYAIIDIAYDGGIQPCGLARAEVNIRKDKEAGLIALWQQGTAEIREDLENGKYRPYCNACCHHFSRNMLASIVRYPVSNRVALMNMTATLLIRATTKIFTKIYSN